MCGGCAIYHSRYIDSDVGSRIKHQRKPNRKMIEIIFWIVLVSVMILFLGLGISIGFPKHRIWPPPGSLQYRTAWMLIVIASVGVPVVGILDWDSLGQLHWIRFLIGGGLIIASSALMVWGLRTLSMHQSLGLEGTLVTSGPYKYTRNPQYLALLVFYSAFILVSSSFLALITGILLILMYALTPLSEEPWLEEQFGDAYLEYKKQVPRFIGFKKKQ